MKILLGFSVICIAAGLGCPQLTTADTITLKSGATLTGTVVRTNSDEILLMTDYAAFNFWQGSIKEIRLDSAEAIAASQSADSDRLPTFQQALLSLAGQPWVADLRAIPATVTDKGTLRNVPYLSFQCGEDYEVNIYGSPDHPAGIEAGVYRKLLTDTSARTNCVNFVAALMGRRADRQTVLGLNIEQDLKKVDGVTFEITPPSAEDAYQGWWISVYSEQGLGLARASEQEMRLISISKSEAQKQAAAGDPTSWSAKDLGLARQAYPTTVSFVTKSGWAITNAEVLRVNDGVSLVWRDGASAGVLKLADLPEDLRVKFSFDADKTAAADAAEAARRARAITVTPPPAPPAVPKMESPGYGPVAGSFDSLPYSRTYSSPSLSAGGSVYVNGYTRKDGTYVHSYTRSAPRR